MSRKKRGKKVGVTIAAFRRACMDMPEAIEGSHMGTADFRVKGRILATLYRAADGFAMVKLKPQQQRSIIEEHPLVFAPIQGGWGRMGATQVRLNAVDAAVLRQVLTIAWRNVAPRALLDARIFRESK